MATPDIGQRISCAQCKCGADVFRRGTTGPKPKTCDVCLARKHPERLPGWTPKGALVSTCVDCGIERNSKGRGARLNSDRCRSCAALARYHSVSPEQRAARYARNRDAILSKAQEKARGRGARPFAEMQRARTEASVAKRTSTCQACGSAFVAKAVDRLKFCSRQCAGELKKKTRPPANSRVWFPSCRECDRVFATRLKATRVCSDECKKQEARRLANEKARAAYHVTPRQCPECATTFTPTYGVIRKKFCSEFCSKRHCSRAARKKRKWVERAASVEAVNPFKVFERDGWRCQCCKKPTPRDRRGTYHPRAPELDHIVPLSKGGEHSYRNTQLLCRACNAAKSDKDEGQQMRLFG